MRCRVVSKIRESLPSLPFILAVRAFGDFEFLASSFRASQRTNCQHLKFGKLQSPDLEIRYSEELTEEEKPESRLESLKNTELAISFHGNQMIPRSFLIQLSRRTFLEFSTHRFIIPYTRFSAGVLYVPIHKNILSLCRNITQYINVP